MMMMMMMMRLSGGGGGGGACPCTWDASYPCSKSGSCYNYKTKGDCEAAGGEFCGEAGPSPNPSPPAPKPSPPAPNPGPPASGSFGTAKGADGWVADHNYFRGLHGAQAVAWDADLAAKAQAWASKLNAENSFQHSDCYGTWPPRAKTLPLGMVVAA